MNTMKNFLLCSALLGLMAWSGCKKEPCTVPTNPDCVNYCFDPTDPWCDGYDSCTAETPVSADFRIIENGSYGPIDLLDTVYYDTVSNTSLITEAIHENSDWSYTWQIGAQRYYDLRTALEYGAAPERTPIPLTLMVEGPPHTDCFPDDDGRDTLTRYVIIDRTLPDTVLFAGYRNGDVSDSLNIMVFMDKEYGRRRYAGLTDSCYGEISNGARTRRNFIYKDASTGCNSGILNLTLDPEKTGDFGKVKGTYSYMEDIYDPDSRLYFRFDGRRIR